MSLFFAALLSIPALPPIPAVIIDPLADELSRFPSREIARFWWIWGMKHRDWLDENMPPLGLVTREERQEWLDYRNEVNCRVDACWYLMKAWEVEECVGKRQGWLDDLRFYIGDENYAAGYLPLPLDLNKMWRK